MQTNHCKAIYQKINYVKGLVFKWEVFSETWT